MSAGLATCLGVGLHVGCSSSSSTAPELSAAVGREYAFELTTHCGIEWARIDGSWWRTEPLNDGNGNSPVGWEDPVQRGKLRLESSDTAQFLGGPEVVMFVRSAITEIDDPALPDSVRFCD